MNKKIITSILVILILSMGLSMSLGSVSAIDSSNWNEVTINGIDFKIPPKYNGGELIGDEGNYTTYMLETVFNFSISALNNEIDLVEVYGYESTIDELKNLSLKHIGGHDVVILHSYRSVCEHDVIYLFYGIGDEIYAISYNGTKITPEIKEIIKNTPKSNMTKNELYKKLDDAQASYVEKQIEYEEAYNYQEAYSAGKNSNKHDFDFVDYYCAYRIANYLMR